MVKGGGSRVKLTSAPEEEHGQWNLKLLQIISAVILDERSVRNLSRSIICSKLSLRDTDHS